MLSNFGNAEANQSVYGNEQVTRAMSEYIIHVNNMVGKYKKKAEDFSKMIDSVLESTSQADQKLSSAADDITSQLQASKNSQQ